jgi:hypothetical protein
MFIRLDSDYFLQEHEPTDFRKGDSVSSASQQQVHGSSRTQHLLHTDFRIVDDSYV